MADELPKIHATHVHKARDEQRAAWHKLHGHHKAISDAHEQERARQLAKKVKAQQEPKP